MDAKMDPQKTAQAQAWMETLSGVKSNGAPLHEYLKNGQVLCKALNAIKKGSVPSVSTSNMPFPQMENIASYLAVCKAWGMKSSDLFMTKDLYENANMGMRHTHTPRHSALDRSRYCLSCPCAVQ